jgi:hypothetical protein
MPRKSVRGHDISDVLINHVIGVLKNRLSVIIVEYISADKRAIPLLVIVSSVILIK